MSTTNLFDLPEINTGNEQPEDNFFDKLDAVEVDYSSLGPTIVNAIKFWSDSYLKKIEYYDDLLKFKKEYWAKAKEGKKHYFEEMDIPDFLEDLDHSMLNNLLSLVRTQYHIEPSSEMYKAFTNVDYGDNEAILDTFSKHTNGGNTESIEREQKMKAIGQYIRTRAHNKPYIKKTKITIPSFYWTKKCRIYEETKIGHSSSNWDKPKDWAEAFKYFAKEHDIDWLMSGHKLFMFYKNNERASEGTFEKREFEDSVLLKSLKLFKNGKMELEFITEALALQFYEEWIIPAQNM